jgi:hypothetical protein
VKIKNKIKEQNVSKLKPSYSENIKNSESKEINEEFDFNHVQKGPITRVCAKLIDYKNGAKLAVTVDPGCHICTVDHCVISAD